MIGVNRDCSHGRHVFDRSGLLISSQKRVESVKSRQCQCDWEKRRFHRDDSWPSGSVYNTQRQTLSDTEIFLHTVIKLSGLIFINNHNRECTEWRRKNFRCQSRRFDPKNEIESALKWIIKLRERNLTKVIYATRWHTEGVMKKQFHKIKIAAENFSQRFVLFIFPSLDVRRTIEAFQCSNFEIPIHRDFLHTARWRGRWRK